MGGEECVGSVVRGGGQGARARIVLVLHECIWNAPAVLIVLPTFDNTGSLGPHPRRVVYPPGFTHTFPYFPVFPLLQTSKGRSAFECCLPGLLLNKKCI